jgi:hypothetical protein
MGEPGAWTILPEGFLALRLAGSGTARSATNTVEVQTTKRSATVSLIGIKVSSMASVEIKVPVLRSRARERAKDPNPTRLPVSRHDVVPLSAS